MATTGYVWHTFPDGGACFPADEGGWIYVSNSEVPVAGGVGAVRFGPDGGIVDAYPILLGTSVNCAGGPTPWNTWLSREEWDGGDRRPRQLPARGRRGRPVPGSRPAEGAW